jgi:hypothetical protein
MKKLIPFALTLLIAALFFATTDAIAAATTYTDRAAFLSAAAAIGSPQTIEFSQKDDGAPITNPSSDAQIDPLTLSGVTFRGGNSYYNLYLYNRFSPEIRAELPAGTYAVGAVFSDFYDAGTLYTITLSTGEVFEFPPSTRGWQFFGAISDTPIQWVTFKLAGDFFLMDNFTFAVSSVVNVNIDIKPGSADNPINLRSNGTTPAAILSSETFDAATIDPTTVTLAGAPVKLRNNGTPMASLEDVNGDGRPDLVLHFVTRRLQLGQNDTQATLEGETFGGIEIQGTDSVRIVR